MYTGEGNHTNISTRNTLKALLDRKGVEDYLVSAVKAIDSRPISKQLIFTCALREINHKLPEKYSQFVFKTIPMNN